MPQSRADKMSQQFLGSDDTGFMAAVAAQMQSSWDKKRKEKEAKYLQTSKAELNACITSRLEEYTAAMMDLNSAYDKFVLDYAQVDDQIRKLWLQLLQEQQKLLALSEKKHKTAVETDKEREKGQVKGMAIAKKAVEGQHQPTPAPICLQLINSSG
ncbi:hypothetical protein L226DRAFT_569275 [Lentinus tigrinus ALCF2SS1-7]|uniref:uncharacterized protein n=1 Tax=Lentinus tigrinus ALCF2SS1-7 TaxID=1328758 RepID=UPI0011660E0F|nr:hypothetical protein L226DRAFT_569275 [Lentinus tigrinus ALCF2SS1-7]